MVINTVTASRSGSRGSSQGSRSSETRGLISKFFTAQDDEFDVLQSQIDRQQKKIEGLLSAIGTLIEILETRATTDDINDLEEQIETLKTMNTDSISDLRMDIEDALIIPPNIALNMAVCIGQPIGLSGDDESDSDDLRCPPGSEQFESEDGLNDRGGMGLGRISGLDSIDDCRDECIDDNGCDGYNWSPINGNSLDGDCDGHVTCCTKYGTPIPNQARDYSVIFCVLNDEPIDPCIIGEVITYAGELPDLPAGFVLANGAAISENDYPYTCDILGEIYGTSDMANECVLPNLEEKFISGAKNDIMEETSNIGVCDGDDTISL